MSNTPPPKPLSSHSSVSRCPIHVQTIQHPLSISTPPCDSLSLSGSVKVPTEPVLNPMEDLYKVVCRSDKMDAESVGDFGSWDERRRASDPTEMPDPIKAQIVLHPRYPDLVAAYIECRNVGAPPEMASLLEEIPRQSHSAAGGGCTAIGDDPELDDFMDSYCEVLQRYREELSKPFHEATLFLSHIESQLSDLCKGTLSVVAAANYLSDEAAGTSEDEHSTTGKTEVVESPECSSPWQVDLELKEMLMRKYNGYLSNLRTAFLKKRRNGKLPKDATTTLLDWWNSHYRWPYPTEEEKLKLSEVTGLDPKQINNWFINQRKRHWKPSENMRLARMGGIAHNIGGVPIYFDTAGGAGNDDN